MQFSFDLTLFSDPSPYAEPTTGLDSRLALTVVKGLEKLAASGRTILCTIHQPSAEVFALFTSLLLLSSGDSVYFGPASKCKEHFESKLLFLCTFENAADFALFVSENRSSFDAKYTEEMRATRLASGEIVLSEVKSAIQHKPSQQGSNITVLAMDSASPLHKAVISEYLIKKDSKVINELTTLDVTGACNRLLDSFNVILTLIHRDFRASWRRNFWRSLTARAIIIGLILGGFI